MRQIFPEIGTNYWREIKPNGEEGLLMNCQLCYCHGKETVKTPFSFVFIDQNVPKAVYN